MEIPSILVPTWYRQKGNSVLMSLGGCQMRLAPSVLCVLAILASYPSVLRAQCGTTPLAPTCNIPKCTPDGFVFVPVAKDTPCQINQQPGQCDGGELLPGSIEPARLGKCIPIVTGSLDPRYYVLHVVYAPPGTAGSGTKSSVTYASGSTLGTEVNTKSSFRSEVSVTASAHLFGFADLSVSSGYAATSASDKGLQVSKGNTIQIAAFGGSADGINHDDDVIYLWLNPRVNVFSVGNDVKWTLGVNGTEMDIQFVSVGQLKGLSPIADGILREFAAHNVSTADFPAILAQDAFANGVTNIDPSRFVETTTSVPYEPPLTPGGLPHPFTVTITNQVRASQTSTNTNEYKVGVTASVGSPLTAKLAVSTQFTWTNSSSSTSSTTSTESASLTVTGPSFGYTGPTNLRVYYDTLYDSFVFVPIVLPASVSGIVLNQSGQPMVHQPVTISVNRVQHHTVTGLDGEFRFFNVPRGTGDLKVNNATQSVTIGGAAVRQNVRMQ
jgi:hypothetical protein